MSTCEDIGGGGLKTIIDLFSQFIRHLSMHHSQTPQEQHQRGLVCQIDEPLVRRTMSMKDLDTYVEANLKYLNRMSYRIEDFVFL